ncbi:NADPH-dependent 2,4-dienoyl-CoA reductase/sulfur reductase-like enzyme [Nocardioides aromaticivorans]|uniref:NADPH-dependent 2,4-dienoyl-CoA reductase/sulfur reductase-like enzyme n=1 Tax=Nocardioides aromaticivorans TaxID=200618 RepID=A0A7Z0CN57_9ACTN|nr:NAD(P)/FAD-dependent oxidoreductase [Nocardioides aromaticivorans]NYI44477.1 NADPH-dependent 2,4-dienoyl-CoA reductase/sulfur reductase-like enzyme [Nocardioides aromaticivorans]
MTRPGAVVIVGESIAGLTAARELRAQGYDGTVTIIGSEPEGAYARPPLSKAVLKDASGETGLSYPCADLDLRHVRSPAVALDAPGRVVTTDDGRAVPYDALLVATGATARRLATPDQRGELVLRTLADARAIRERMDHAASVIVIGAGFLGMEVASAAAARGLDVTVIDTEPPLRRLLGSYLSDRLAAHAAARGVRTRQVSGPVELAGTPVRGVTLPDGDTLTADLVVTCAGDLPAVGWLSGTPLADPAGIAIDERCSTSVPGVFAAGDVARLSPSAGCSGSRAPFWSNAVAQGKVAAASMLGQDSPLRPTDDYFWTEILGLSIKVAGPLPLTGAPASVDGDVQAGDAILRWDRPGQRTTAVAFGRKVPVGRLRALARDSASSHKEKS